MCSPFPRLLDALVTRLRALLNSDKDGDKQTGAPMSTHVPLSHLETIEQATRRTVSIETKCNSESLSKCHPQDQASLFSLPPELRLQIFAIATSPVNHPDFPYRAADTWYRPGQYEARHITSTTLLLTCRRIWLEASHLPLWQSTLTFWPVHSRPVQATATGRTEVIRVYGMS